MPRSKLSKRMLSHVAGTATDFTAANPPLALEALYTAPRRSVEAYAFYSLMPKLPMSAVSYGRIGGWTQTRPTTSQLCGLKLREEKRMLSDSCLACGSSDHFTREKKNVGRRIGQILCQKTAVAAVPRST